MIDHNEKFLRTHKYHRGLGGPACRAPRARMELRTSENDAEVTCWMCRRYLRKLAAQRY